MSILNRLLFSRNQQCIFVAERDLDVKSIKKHIFRAINSFSINNYRLNIEYIAIDCYFQKFIHFFWFFSFAALWIWIFFFPFTYSGNNYFTEFNWPKIQNTKCYMIEFKNLRVILLSRIIFDFLIFLIDCPNFRVI